MLFKFRFICAELTFHRYTVNIKKVKWLTADYVLSDLGFTKGSDTSQRHSM